MNLSVVNVEVVDFEELKKTLVSNGVESQWIAKIQTHLEELISGCNKYDDIEVYLENIAFEKIPDYDMYSVRYKIVRVYGADGIELVVWVENNINDDEE